MKTTQFKQLISAIFIKKHNDYKTRMQVVLNANLSQEDTENALLLIFDKKSGVKSHELVKSLLNLLDTKEDGLSTTYLNFINVVPQLTLEPLIKNKSLLNKINQVLKWKDIDASILSESLNAKLGMILTPDHNSGKYFFDTFVKNNYKNSVLLSRALSNGYQLTQQDWDEQWNKCKKIEVYLSNSVIEIPLAFNLSQEFHCEKHLALFMKAYITNPQIQFPQYGVHYVNGVAKLLDNYFNLNFPDNALIVSFFEKLGQSKNQFIFPKESVPSNIKLITTTDKINNHDKMIMLNTLYKIMTNKEEMDKAFSRKYNKPYLPMFEMVKLSESVSEQPKKARTVKI